MPSPSPLLYDTYYHIYNRGNNRENIFIQERNYEYFLKLYTKYIEPVVDTFAYSLLRNHFHVSLRVKSEEEILKTLTPIRGQAVSPGKKTLKVSSAITNQVGQGSPVNQGLSQSGKPLGSAMLGSDLLGSDALGPGVLRPDYPSQQFSNFFNAYAKAINSAYGRTGSLFQHPFGRVLITSDRQFWNVIAYIHQNPQKHKFVEDFRDWKWSSYGILLAEKPTRLKRDVVLDWFGGRQQYLDLHQEWVTEANSKWFAEDDYD